jgi:hypothetical protein
MMTIIYYPVTAVGFLFIKVVILFKVILTMDGLESPSFPPSSSLPPSQRSYDLRLCDVCEKNLDPQLVTCVLCSHNGSALKMTENPQNWIHPLCGNWIPDVFIDSNGVYNISRIAPVRYKIGCKLCHRKGAIIQCSYGRCAVSAHPWCAVKLNLGFTHRIVKNPEISPPLLWEIFCKSHANCVYEPVKPKVATSLSLSWLISVCLSVCLSPLTDR